MSSDSSLSALASNSTPFQPPPGFKGSGLPPGSKMSTVGVIGNGPENGYTQDTTEDVGGSSSSSSAVSSHPSSSSTTESKPTVTYNDLFPSLPTSSRPVTTSEWRPAITARAPVAKSTSKADSKSGSVSKTPAVSREASERFQIPAGSLVQRSFGDRSPQDIVKAAMAETSTAVEMQTSRDGTITILIQGKTEDVLRAKKRLLQKLVKQVELKISVPKDYHRFLIGRKGETRQLLENKTNARIIIPKEEDESDDILVSGDAQAVQAARVEIFNLVSERTNIGRETLNIDKTYHLFLQNSDRLRQLLEATNVKLRYGSEINADEILVTGGKKEVADVILSVQEVYQELRRLTKSVSVTVSKKQHRFVIGPKGVNIQEILKATGCAIQVPQAEEPGENITIVGEEKMLLKALQMVMEKAASVSFEEIQIPNVIHQRYFNHRGRSKLREFEKDKVQISFNGTAVELQGPPEELNQIRGPVTEFIKSLKNWTFEEVEVPADLRKFVIGKDGQNLKKMKADHDVDVIVPGLVEDGSDADSILLVGSKDKVKIVKDLLSETVKEMANLAVEKLQIDPKFHRAIVGAKGTTVKKLSEKYENVSIKVPNAGDNSDQVIVRGPRAEVDDVVKEINALVEEARHFEVMNSFTEELMIERRFIKYIVGREGGTINRIRQAHNVRIDIEGDVPEAKPEKGKEPASDEKPHVEKNKKGDKKAEKTDKAAASSSSSGPSKEDLEKQRLVIRGTKAGVEAAKKELLAKVKEMVDGGGYVLEELTIESKYHGQMIGPKGQYVNSLMDRLSISVQFPPSESGSNVVVLKGLKKSVEKAKAELLEVLEYEMERNWTERVAVPSSALPDLMGRNGTRKSQELVKILQATNTRADIAESNDGIVISGNKKDVVAAVKDVKALVKQLSDRVSEEVPVHRKYFPALIGRKGARVQELSERHNITIRFPPGSDKDFVFLQGPSKDVAAAKDELLAAVEELKREQEAQFTLPITIPHKDHSSMREFVRSLLISHKVRVNFPRENENPDTVLIVGTEEACHAAYDLLLTNTPATAEVTIPSSLRGKLLGQGKIREISQKHSVNIKLPPQTSTSEISIISGGKASVEAAKQELESLLGEDVSSTNGGDRVRYEFNVDQSLHGAIIGRGGSTINGIMAKSGARVDLTKGSDVVVLRGRQEQVDEAERAILAIVDEQKSQESVTVRVNPRYYGAIIGSKGSTLRSLQNDFNVQINVPSSTSSSDKIIIKGQIDDAKAARDEILRIVDETKEDEDDSQPEPVRVPEQKKKQPQQEFDPAFFAPPDAAPKNVPTGAWGSGRSLA